MGLSCFRVALISRECIVCLGLSHMASASYTEDVYGVVQQTLPELLTILFSLLEVRLGSYYSSSSLQINTKDLRIGVLLTDCSLTIVGPVGIKFHAACF